MQYDPVLPNDPRRVLSHNYDVCDLFPVQAALINPCLGRQRPAHNHVPRSTGVNFARLRIRPRHFHEPNLTLRHLRCSQRKLQQSPIGLHCLWVACCHLNYATHGAKKEAARKMVSIDVLFIYGIIYTFNFTLSW